MAVIRICALESGTINPSLMRVLPQVPSYPVPTVSEKEGRKKGIRLVSQLEDVNLKIFNFGNKKIQNSMFIYSPKFKGNTENLNTIGNFNSTGNNKAVTRFMDSINEENSLASSQYEKTDKNGDSSTIGRRIMKANYDSELQKMKKAKARSGEKPSFTKKLLGLMGCCTDR